MLTSYGTCAWRPSIQMLKLAEKVKPTPAEAGDCSRCPHISWRVQTLRADVVGHLFSMSKFLLRDGSVIDVNTEPNSEDVFTYSDVDGVSMHALVSAAAESRLLATVPSNLLSLSQRMQLSQQKLSA